MAESHMVATLYIQHHARVEEGIAYACEYAKTYGTDGYCPVCQPQAAPAIAALNERRQQRGLRPFPDPPRLQPDDMDGIDITPC